MKFQITIKMMQEILKHHENTASKNSDCSNTIEFEFSDECDTHLGSTPFHASIKSNYSECNNIGLVSASPAIVHGNR